MTSPHPWARRRARGLLARGTALAAATTVLVGGCADLDSIQLRQDDRLEIESPRNLSTVDLPFEVSWTAPEIRTSGSGPTSGQQFAVLLDRYPMPPGEDLRWIVDQSRTCRGSDACLAPDYLADRLGIYLTPETSVTVERLPPVNSDQPAAESHYATIVLLDAEDQRVGESVWYVSFKVGS